MRDPVAEILSLDNYNLDIDTINLIEFCCGLKSEFSHLLWENMMEYAVLEGKHHIASITES